MDKILLQNLNRFVVIAWMIFQIITPASAQLIELLTTKDGLPQSFVSGLVQDQKGFVWVGTRNGLARFDGIAFRPFRYSTSDSSSLTSNVILSLKPHQGKIVIEYESGEMDLFDPDHEELTRLFPRKMLTGTLKELQLLARSWIMDENQMLWGVARGKGIIKYNLRTRKINRYHSVSNATHSHSHTPAAKLIANSTPAGDTIWGIRPEKGHHMWILTQNGLIYFNSNNSRAIHYSLPKSARYFLNRKDQFKTVDLHIRRNGELMWGDRRWLFIFSPQSKKIRTVALPGASDHGVLWIDSGPDGYEYLEREGIVYKFSDGSGLSAVADISDKGKIHVQSFLVDDSGLIWLGTNGHGLYQVDVKSPYFPSLQYKNNFAADLLDREFHTSLQNFVDKTATRQKISASGYHIRSTTDQRGQLWVGLFETVMRLHVDENKNTVLPKVLPLYNPAESAATIRGIAVNSAGIPLVASYNGDVVIYNEAGKRWDWFIKKGEVRRRFGNKLLITSILLDEKKLWMATDVDGLLFVDLKTKQIGQVKTGDQNQGLPTNQLLGMQPDPTRSHLIWIGSYNGLIRFDKNTFKAKVFDAAIGIPDQTIYSLLPDHFGNLWFGTNKGLCRFDPIKLDVQVFQTRHGLIGDEFNRFHQMPLPGGRLAFGGTEGWTSFDPNQIAEDDYFPATALTGLKINNLEMLPSANHPIIRRPINTMEELVLEHDQNTLTFSFAGLQFTHPQDIKYRYQLVEYDKDWVFAGQNSIANYTQIPPGKYEFKVSASNTAGNWSDKIKSIKITVHAPWWNAWWFYLIITAIFISAIYSLYRYRLAQVLKLQKLRNDIARDLHDDVGSSISSIAIFSKIALDQVGTSTFKSEPLLIKITEQANQIMGSMNDIVWSINSKNDAFDEVLIRMREQASQLLETRGYTLHFDFDEHIGRTKLEMERRRDFYLIYKESLNNIAKYANGKNVWISIHLQDSAIHMTIRDDGVGFQSDAIRSNGNGINNMRYRAATLKGKLQINSAPGEGTTLHLSL